MDGFFAESNRIQVIKDDKSVFDTENPSVERFPEDTFITLSSYEIYFPSYIQKTAYYRNQTFGVSECELWSTLISQKWGPDETYHNEVYYEPPGTPIPGPTTRNLARTLLGSVPPETTYLDVRVKLTRTQTPPARFGLELPLLLFEEDKWNTLPGGSCPTEIIGGIAARLFNIKRIDDNIYLERFQSVYNTNSPLAPGGYAQANISVNQSGWNSQTSSATSDGSSIGPYANQILYHLINRKPYSADGNKRPGGTNPCSGPFPDLTTRLTGDIIIVPGRYRT